MLSVMEPSPTCPSAKARVGDPLHAEMLALRAGRSESLRAIYDAASPRVHGLALRITGDARLAEEATVETFVRAWRRAATYDPARGDAFAAARASRGPRAVLLGRAPAHRDRRAPRDPARYGEDEDPPRSDPTRPSPEIRGAGLMRTALHSGARGPAGPRMHP